MSPRRWEERVQDILDTIAEISAFVAMMEFADFQNDLKTMRAVELDFIVIGEAANAIPDDVQEAYPQIAWQLMRGCVTGWCIHIFWCRRNFYGIPYNKICPRWRNH